MSSEEMNMSSDDEEEAIAAAIDDDDDEVRYSLFSRTIPKSSATMIAASGGIEYQRRHADELDEGRRAIERIASGAAYTSDEPYIHTGPRSLYTRRETRPTRGSNGPTDERM